MYSGYIHTAHLWRGTLCGMEQLELLPFPDPPLSTAITSSLRLGMLAELITFDYWEHSPQVDIIARNIQVQGKKATLGEIDAIIRVFQELTHVEIAYKIYLYDPNYGSCALEHWIGPNRKDTLVDKLQRLKTHQLPLIATVEGHAILKEMMLQSEDIVSKVWMKGQLFLPQNENIDVAPLNPESVSGIYVYLKDFSQFEGNKFFLPTKQQWIEQPKMDVKWLDFSAISKEIEPLLANQFAPMLWMKTPKGILSKMFVVWW